MGELNLELAIKRRPEPQRSVPDKLSKMQSMSSLQGVGLTDPTHNSHAFEMMILQTPKDCRIAGKAETDKRMVGPDTSASPGLTLVAAKASKWPLDPAPVVEFKLHDGDSSRSYLHSPFWFCSAALEPVSQSVASASSALAGCLVSSLHKVKLQDNIGEHGLFIFGDLHAKIAGKFRLRFTLYELRSNADTTYVATLASKLSDTFVIHSGKSWPGQAESTQLSRHLCDSGVKLRIRKETSKRKAQSQDWSSDKRTAVTSFTLPMPMGPPPNNRRRLTGEDITPDQVRFAGGLGIKGAMDREQYTNAQSHPRVGYTGVGDYRSPLDTYPSLSNSYLGQSSLGYENRAPGVYNPTPYAATQYTAGQIGYGSMAGTIKTQETRSGHTVTFIPHPTARAPQQPHSAGSSSVGTNRYGTSHVDNASSSDMDRYSATNNMEGLSSMYGGRSGYTEQGASYEDDRTERSMLLPEPTGTSNSHLPGWNSTSLSTIDPPRSS